MNDEPQIPVEKPAAANSSLDQPNRILSPNHAWQAPLALLLVSCISSSCINVLRADRQSVLALVVSVIAISVTLFLFAYGIHKTKQCLRDPRYQIKGKVGGVLHTLLIASFFVGFAGYMLNLEKPHESNVATISPADQMVEETSKKLPIVITRNIKWTAIKRGPYNSLIYEYLFHHVDRSALGRDQFKSLEAEIVSKKNPNKLQEIRKYGFERIVYVFKHQDGTELHRFEITP